MAGHEQNHSTCIALTHITKTLVYKMGISFLWQNRSTTCLAALFLTQPCHSQATRPPYCIHASLLPQQALAPCLQTMSHSKFQMCSFFAPSTITTKQISASTSGSNARPAMPMAKPAPALDARLLTTEPHKRWQTCPHTSRD